MVTTAKEPTQAMGKHPSGNVIGLFASGNQNFVDSSLHFEHAVAVQRMERADPVPPPLRDNKSL